MRSMTKASMGPVVGSSLSPSCSFRASRNVGPVGSGWKLGGGVPFIPLNTGAHSRDKLYFPVRPVRLRTGRSSTAPLKLTNRQDACDFLNGHTSCADSHPPRQLHPDDACAGTRKLRRRSRRRRRVRLRARSIVRALDDPQIPEPKNPVPPKEGATQLGFQITEDPGLNSLLRSFWRGS